MLTRRPHSGRRITLVPLIDVLFILLVYFMVTSVYRDLNMIPVVQISEQSAAPSVQLSQGETLLLRIASDGTVALRGQPLDAASLATVLNGATGRVLILPSGNAPLHAMTELLDAVTIAGITDARLIRLEASE